MAPKAKRKYVSKNDQEEMLKAFYDGLGDNENSFLGHKFSDADEIDTESDSSDDNDYDNDEDNERNDGDVMEEKECEIEDDSNYNNDVIPEGVSNTSEGERNSENKNNKNNEAENLQKEPARKQKFKNINQVMNENNYLGIPGNVFRYQDAKKNKQKQKKNKQKKQL